MDVAFSRDSTPRAYVQDRLREAGKELFAWLEGGAHLYVCGDAEHMAPDVHEALVDIVAAHGGLDRDGRRVVRQAACRRPPLPAGRVLTMAEQSPVERIKRESRLLRGTLVESLADPLTGAIREDDTALIKFHGSYQQDDRDIREERRRPEARARVQLHDPHAAARRRVHARSSGSRSTRSPAATATARSGSPRARLSSCTA